MSRSAWTRSRATYTLKLTVTDKRHRRGRAARTLTRTFEVAKKEFGIVRREHQRR